MFLLKLHSLLSSELLSWERNLTRKVFIGKELYWVGTLPQSCDICPTRWNTYSFTMKIKIVYICIYVCVCMYMYVYIYVYIYVCVYVCVYIYNSLMN